MTDTSKLKLLINEYDEICDEYNEKRVEYIEATKAFNEARKSILKSAKKFERLFRTAQFKMTSELLAITEVNHGIKSGRMTQISSVFFFHTIAKKPALLYAEIYQDTHSCSAYLPLEALVEAITSGKAELTTKPKKERKNKKEETNG